MDYNALHALYGGARVDGSIFAPCCFLVSSKPRLFPGFFKTSPVSWFLQNLACFLVSSKSRPFSCFLYSNLS